MTKETRSSVNGTNFSSKRILNFSHPLNMDYCPRCHRRTEHVKSGKDKMCKRCGLQEQRTLSGYRPSSPFPRPSSPFDNED